MKLRNYFNANFWTKKTRSEIKETIRQKLDVSTSTVSNWLSGRCNPPEYAQIIIAEVLGVPVTDLF